MAMGAGALALPSKAAISDATDRTERRKRINIKADIFTLNGRGCLTEKCRFS
jgi:hypothetical protein